MIQQGFITPWSIFTPTAFRLMPRKYVETFFATGELKLSSFTDFSRHRDEERKDKDEGQNVLVGRGPASTIYARTVHGSDAYILCATACRPSAELLNRFESNAAIQIFDTTGFAAAVTKHIPGVRQGFEGYCYYSDGGIEYKIPDIDVEHFKSNPREQTLDLSKLGGFLQNLAGNAVFFRKNPEFRHQLEYRWIWIAPTRQDSLIVNAPDARAFCLPWYPEDVEQGAAPDIPASRDRG
jgi:hypothetical protein